MWDLQGEDLPPCAVLKHMRGKSGFFLCTIMERKVMENKEISILRRLNALSRDEASVFDPDIRNWTVLGDKGFRLGRVADLWIDERELNIRYLEVDLEDDPGKKILLPVGMIALNRKENFVVAVDVRKSELHMIPAFTGAVTRDYEVELRKTYLPGNVSVTDWQKDFYNHNHFNEHGLFKERQTLRDKMKNGNT